MPVRPSPHEQPPGDAPPRPQRPPVPPPQGPFGPYGPYGPDGPEPGPGGLSTALKRGSLFLAILLSAGALVYLLFFAPETWREELMGWIEPSSPDPQQTTIDLGNRDRGSAPETEGVTIPLSIESTPAGATVFVDGESIGTTPLDELPISAGVYLVSLKREDYFSFDTLLVLDAGQRSSFSFALRSRQFASGRAGGEPAREASPPRQQEDEPPASPEEPTASAPAEPPARRETPPDAPARAPATGNLVVTSQPPGASVWLEDQSLGVAPLTQQRLEPGTYRVTLRRDGYKVHTADVTVEPGQVASLHTTLEKAEGTLKVLVKPWGSIYIDGRLHKSDTNVQYTTSLPTGAHRLTIVHPSLGRWEETITISEDEERTVVADLNAQR